MTAIATFTEVPFGVSLIRSASAQATTGQTDWLRLPPRATYASIYFNLTAVAGNTPIVTPSFLVPDPITLDDAASLINLGEHAAFTGITAAAQYVFDIGPGITGIANDVTNAATADSYVSLNVILPAVLGVKLLNDRTSADETYTYKLSILVK